MLVKAAVSSCLTYLLLPAQPSTKSKKGQRKKGKQTAAQADRRDKVAPTNPQASPQAPDARPPLTAVPRESVSSDKPSASVGNKAEGTQAAAQDRRAHRARQDVLAKPETHSVTTTSKKLNKTDTRPAKQGLISAVHPQEQGVRDSTARAPVTAPGNAAVHRLNNTQPLPKTYSAAVGPAAYNQHASPPLVGHKRSIIGATTTVHRGDPRLDKWNKLQDAVPSLTAYRPIAGMPPLCFGQMLSTSDMPLQALCNSLLPQLRSFSIPDAVCQLKCCSDCLC